MSDTTAFTGFYMNRRGGMSVDREKLHASEGYKRQIDALAKLFDDKGTSDFIGSDTKGG